MTAETQALLRLVATELSYSEDELLRQGLRSFLERQLRETRARIFELHSLYGVSSVEEMDRRYQDGSLDEASSWQDLQALDHLEYKQSRLQELIGRLS